MATNGSRAFRGWPPGAVAFFAELEADNTKAWWEANRARYDADVRGPMDALGEALPEAYRPLHVFRPHRDVRFSKDKRPYKTAIGAVGEREGGAVFYVQLSADGLLAASGYHRMAADQLARYREAVADEGSGPAIAAAVASVEAAGLDVGGETLKVGPRGWPRDHPRADLLRRKALTVGRSYPPARWLSGPGALDRIVAVWEAAEPVNAWLDTHVGPSTLPPEELR